MKLTCIPVLAAVFLFAACGKEDHKHAPGDAHNQPESADKHEGHGALTKLGTIQLGDIAVEVAQEGKFEAGKELGVEVTFPKGKPMPQTLRAWVGIESAAGSMKAKLTKEEESVMHGHLEVPSPLPAGSKIWIEAEGAGGTTKASISPR